MTQQLTPSTKCCPFPKCTRPGRPFMCNEHWALVPPDVRRALVQEVALLKRVGQRTPSKKLVEIHLMAMKAIARAIDNRSAPTAG